MTPKPKSLYGQYCPLSQACELLCNRWTMLVIRELLDGSTAFNQIGRGVPAMSRNLLSQRLKELEGAGILTCQSSRRGVKGNYRLTPAGEALGTVVRSMSAWGQAWIDVEPSLHQIDVNFLMWDMRRNVKPLPDLPPRFTVHFHFPDAAKTLKEHWLVFENNEVELCHFDPGHEVNVGIESDLRTMTMVWMGWEDFATAQREGRLQIRGDRQFVIRTKEWLGLSKLAGIPKQPESMRVLRQWSGSPQRTTMNLRSLARNTVN